MNMCAWVHTCSLETPGCICSFNHSKNLAIIFVHIEQYYYLKIFETMLKFKNGKIVPEISESFWILSFHYEAVYQLGWPLEE